MAGEQNVSVNVDVNEILDEMAAENATLKKDLVIQRATNRSLMARLAEYEQAEAAKTVKLAPGNRAERRRAAKKAPAPVVKNITA